MEHFIDRGTQVTLVVDAHLEHTEQEGDEVKFVSRSVINSLVGSKGLLPVDFNFWNRELEAWN